MVRVLLLKTEGICPGALIGCCTVAWYCVVAGPPPVVWIPLVAFQFWSNVRNFQLPAPVVPVGAAIAAPAPADRRPRPASPSDDAATMRRVPHFLLIAKDLLMALMGSPLMEPPSDLVRL